MTEKRFKVKEISYYNSYSFNSGTDYIVYETVISKGVKGKIIKEEVEYARFISLTLADRLCDFLNELHEENKELKQENKELQFAYDECSNNKLFSRRKLETENKKLKDENIRLSKDKQLAETEIIRIRQTLNDAIETERTNIGQSVLKQFKEQIQ